MKKTARILLLASVATFFTVAVCIVTYSSIETLSQGERSIAVDREDSTSSTRDNQGFFKQGWLSKLVINPFRERTHQVIAVVIENHEDARPHQKGLHEALIVEEWMVEGLVSRFIAIFDMQRVPDLIGPVRSLRPYFVDGTQPWITHFIHAGGSPEALERIEDNNLISINALKGAYYDYFVRLDGVYPPHDLFIEREQLYTMFSDMVVPDVRWPPYEQSKAPSASGASLISINFYNTLHNASFQYDENRKAYSRSNGGVEGQAFPKNVLVVELPIVGVGEYGRLTIPIIDSANSVLFRDGRVYEGYFSRNAESGTWEFTSQDDDTIGFASGQLWLTVVPNLSRLSWET